MVTKTNKHPVERIFIDDKRVKPQTIAHHIARYKFACKIIPPEGTVLDLACGTGYGTDMLRSAGYLAIGADIDKPTIDRAKKEYPKCMFMNVNIVDLIPFLTPHVDLVTFFEGIEHLPFKDGLKVLKKISKILDKGKTLIVSTPRDINDKYNRLHKSEWPYHVLKNELGSLFSDVRIYGQDWDDGTIDEEDVRNNDFFICVCKK